MSTTDTTAFNLDLNEIIQEAYDRCGVQVHTGYDFKSARRSLNLLFMDWANKGLNLWTIKEASIPMVQGQIVYDLPLDCVDVLDCVIRTGTGTNQVDIGITRIGSTDYINRPNKNAQGRPIQYWVDRRTGATNSTGQPQPAQIYMYLTPNQSNYYTLVYYYLRRMQDSGFGVNTQDIPFRLMPALIAGLTFYIAQKVPEAFPRLADLKAIYDEAWQNAADEDREKATYRLTPRISTI
jgi:hypothetical protein